MAKAQVRYSFPDPALFDLVAALGEFTVTGTGALTDLAPPDMTILMVPLAGVWASGRGDGSLSIIREAILAGPSSTANKLSGEAGRAFLVGLHPLCWPALFGRKASMFADSQTPFAELAGEAGAELVHNLRSATDFESRVAITNRFFLDWPRNPVPAEQIAQIGALRAALADPDCATAAECAARVGLSPSRLLRLAKSAFGYAPKLLIRIARFRRMLHRADRHSYGQWRAFMDSQYVDQSHLIRDFQEFLGLSPTAYFALERPFVEAAFAEARRLLGDPGLHEGA